MFVILKSKTNYYAVHLEGSKDATELVGLGYWEVAQAETKEAAIDIIKALTNPPKTVPGPPPAPSMKEQAWN